MGRESAKSTKSKQRVQHCVASSHYCILIVTKEKLALPRVSISDQFGRAGVVVSVVVWIQRYSCTVSSSKYLWLALGVALSCSRCQFPSHQNISGSFQRSTRRDRKRCKRKRESLITSHILCPCPQRRAKACVCVCASRQQFPVYPTHRGSSLAIYFPSVSQS